MILAHGDGKDFLCRFIFILHTKTYEEYYDCAIGDSGERMGFT